MWTSHLTQPPPENEFLFTSAQFVPGKKTPPKQQMSTLQRRVVMHKQGRCKMIKALPPLTRRRSSSKISTLGHIRKRKLSVQSESHSHEKQAAGVSDRRNYGGGVLLHYSRHIRSRPVRAWVEEGAYIATWAVDTCSASTIGIATAFLAACWILGSFDKSWYCKTLRRQLQGARCYEEG